MTTQRKLKRIQLITSLEVCDPVDGRVLGVLLDITVEGMGLRLRERLDPQALYRLRLGLPAEFNGARWLDLVARCAWVVPSSNPDLFNVGFQFVEIAPDEVEVIEDLIRRYQR